MAYNFLKSVQLVLGLFVIGLLSGCITPTIEGFDNSSNLGNSDKYLAFVGERVQIDYYDQCKFFEESAEEDETNDESRLWICLDLAFKARYKILELVHGDYDRELVDFVAFDHYGFPRFAKQEFVMMYLREEDGALYHVKYQYDDVFPTKDGRYAFCGNPYLSLDEEDMIEPRPLEDIIFEPPVIKKISDYLPDEKDYEEDQQDRLAKHHASVMAFYSEPDFEITGDLARCKRGVYPEELFRIKNEEQFSPNLRREQCEVTLGLPDGSRNSSTFTKEISACEAEMKSNNLP